jgi:hypothetical protein
MDILAVVAIVSSSSLMGFGKVLAREGIGDVDTVDDADPGGALTS